MSVSLLLFLLKIHSLSEWPRAWWCSPWTCPDPPASFSPVWWWWWRGCVGWSCHWGAPTGHSVKFRQKSRLCRCDQELIWPSAGMEINIGSTLLPHITVTVLLTGGPLHLHPHQLLQPAGQAIDGHAGSTQFCTLSKHHLPSSLIHTCNLCLGTAQLFASQHFSPTVQPAPPSSWCCCCPCSSPHPSTLFQILCQCPLLCHEGLSRSWCIYFSELRNISSFVDILSPNHKSPAGRSSGHPSQTCQSEPSRWQYCCCPCQRTSSWWSGPTTIGLGNEAGTVTFSNIL